MKKYLESYVSILSTKKKIEIGKKIEKDIKIFHTIALFLFIIGTIKWGMFQVKIINNGGLDDILSLLFNIWAGFILLLGIACTLQVIFRHSVFDENSSQEVNELCNKLEVDIPKDIINTIKNEFKES